MSKKVQIDDLFRNRLEDYASPTPVDLWAAVEANLEEQPAARKQRPFWLFMTLFLFVVSALGLGLYLKSDNNKLDLKPTAIQTNLAMMELPSTTTTNNKNEINTPSKAAMIVDAANNNTENHLTQKSNSQTNSSEINKQNTSNQINNANNNNVESGNKEDKVNGKTTSSILETKNARIFEEHFNLTPDSEGQQESSANAKDQQPGATNSIKKNTVFNSSLEKNTPRFPVVPLFQTSIQKFPRGKFTGSCPNLFKIEPRPIFSFDVLAGGDYALRILKVRNSNEVTYVNIRKETEKYASSYSFGGRFSVAYESGFVWRIGLMYNRLTEKIDLVGKAGYEHIENVELLNQLNKYQFVDVPILLGYQTEIGRMTWGLNAGAYFNLFFNAPDNFILDENKEPIDLDAPAVVSETPVFKGQIGLSFYTSLTATYSLSDNVAIICEPNLRVQTQSLTLDSNPLEQRYVHMGLMTGLRVKF